MNVRRDVGVRDQVDVALPVFLLLVGKAMEFLGERPQRLREQPDRRHLDRKLAGLGLEYMSRRADEVAQVPVLERVVDIGADGIRGDVELDAAAHVLHRREARLAHHALQHHPPGDRHARLQRLQLVVGLRAVARMEVDGERVAAEVVGERLSLRRAARRAWRGARR